jgi:hypothetical protein
MTRSFFALGLLALLVVAGPAAGQEDPASRLSPIGIARTHVGETYLKVTYGRPYVRDRLIFGPPAEENGPLVPFGQVWRTGANEATELTVTGPVLLAGHRLEAGTYSVFTVPGPDRWTVHISPDLGLDGTGLFDMATQTFTPVFDPARDVLTLTVPSTRMEQTVDPFTIEFESTDTGADLLFRWERTEVRIPVTLP